ncbi:MAG: formylglycine-generating enzyme family protein [Planctomycetes bacterium]|nr:formylglycine-generating enzyme family protein [Planctomycetota bacterium]
MKAGRAVVFAFVFAVAAVAQAVTIDWVTVGDAGNAADTRYDYPPGYGAVDYEFRIGKYEITAGQYTEFLNAVAATDTYGLYNGNMWIWDYGCKIQQSGSPGSYTYSVAPDRADRPVNYVSFWDAARFANWMHNGQPTGTQGPGTTEDGAYINVGNQTTFARVADALFFIATEDEWYKAAYHDPNKGGQSVPGYWTYPTMSDTALTAEAPPGTNSVNGSANYDWVIGAPYYTTPVGAYTFMPSASAYGTFDQGGNLWEWNETAIGSSRGARGGSWVSGSSDLSASSRIYGHPSGEGDDVGFRLAGSLESTAIPEPATVSLFGIAALAAMLRRRRRRA